MIYTTWLIMLGLLTLFFTDQLDRQHNPNRSITSHTDTTGRPHVVLQRNRAGHYLSRGTINGHPVEFLLDTGATDVAIPIDMAATLGLTLGRPRRYQTANGPVTAYLTRINRLTIGPIEVRNVSASLNPGMRHMNILLGMSLLKHIEFTQRGNTLTLTPMSAW